METIPGVLARSWIQSGAARTQTVTQVEYWRAGGGVTCYAAGLTPGFTFWLFKISFLLIFKICLFFLNFIFDAVYMVEKDAYPCRPLISLVRA